MRSWTVRTRIVVAFFALVATMLVFSAFTVSRLTAIENAATRLLNPAAGAETPGRTEQLCLENSTATAASISGLVKRTKYTIFISLGLGAVFGLLGGYGFRRVGAELATLMHQVRQAGEQVSTSAATIATTARQQQTTATEIATTTTQIGVTSNEISATSKQLVKTMGEVADVAESTAELAAGGQTGLGRMTATMRQILEASGSISARLGVLNERANNINTVVTTITKVADQTNLLSLNAAIEAEKAGEYGRGFGVVASEIRRLADQTAIATYDIEQMVKEMQSAVAAGVMGMDKFAEEVRRGADVVTEVGHQLAQIIERVQALTPRFEVVKDGMEAQSTGAQQISEALGQLSEAAHQTVQSLTESHASITQLNGAASALNSGVSRFVVRV